MNKIMYYFLMTLGVISMLVGLFSFSTGGDFSAYFYSIFIGITLIGTTYYNYKKKKNL
jgi:uncharacterized membrane protein